MKCIKLKEFASYLIGTSTSVTLVPTLEWSDYKIVCSIPEILLKSYSILKLPASGDIILLYAGIYGLNYFKWKYVNQVGLIAHYSSDDTKSVQTSELFNANYENSTLSYADVEVVGNIKNGNLITQYQFNTGVDILLKRLGASGHIPLSHTLWSQVIKVGDIVIDATCGNGNDSLLLAKLSIDIKKGTLYCIDIQGDAIKNTQTKLGSELGDQLINRIKFYQQNFTSFPNEILPNSVKCIVYNLGYLPRGNITIITQAQDTLQSLRAALPLIKRGGLLSVTCYRGHEGGEEEAAAVRQFVTELDPEKWRVFSHDPINRILAPILITVYKI